MRKDSWGEGVGDGGHGALTCFISQGSDFWEVSVKKMGAGQAGDPLRLEHLSHSTWCEEQSVQSPPQCVDEPPAHTTEEEQQEDIFGP